MDTRDHNAPSAARDAALSRVFAYRERGQARPMPVRAALAVFGGVLLVASIPMIVLLPEVGIPALLIALRLLAVEADWAARAYAWTTGASRRCATGFIASRDLFAGRSWSACSWWPPRSCGYSFRSWSSVTR
ncbi:MAG: hypothetical protein WBW75_27795 [Mycobacterium sp.]